MCCVAVDAIVVVGYYYLCCVVVGDIVVGVSGGVGIVGVVGFEVGALLF